MIHEGRYVPGTGARWAMLAGALVLGWAAARAAVQSTFQDDDPQAAAQFWPPSGVTLSSLARARVATANGDIDDTTRSLYRSALAHEPLLSDPLALAGLDAASAGDGARAERLMIAARNRDPRAAIPRFWLFDHFVRTGAYPLALNEVGPAISLQPDAITAILTVLAAIADTPDGRVALSQKLATRPFWRTSFFQTAANNTRPDTMLALLSALPDSNRATEEQRFAYTSLISSGQGARAFQMWHQLLPAAYRDRGGPIYDGNFGGWPGARPFNWSLGDGSIGTARMVSAGDLPQATALDVRYFGSTGGVLAEQFTYAAPGPYRLQFAARRRTSGATGGQLNMEVRCITGAVLATLPLQPLEGQLRTLSTPLTVPAGCPLVRVQLVGTPGDLFSEVEAQVTGVTLVAGG